MTTVLADIGGTHARFAAAGRDGLHNPEKLKAADYENFADALAAYAARHGLKPGPLAVATAAVEGADGVWRFQNENRWTIDSAGLEKAGWNTKLIVNDFVASARGVAELPAESLILLRGRPDAFPDRPRAVLGPGTGLGLAYITPLGGGAWHVQHTHGGHMLAAALTDEQMRILPLVRRIRGGDTVAVPEDIASGRGLPVLYQAVCRSIGLVPQAWDQRALLDNAAEPAVKQTLRLFHEFLGLFAHQAVITGHAYGGLYLDGGLISVLRARGLFDFESFSRFLLLDVVPSVRRDLEAMPVRAVEDTYTALYGLKEMMDG